VVEAHKAHAAKKKKTDPEKNKGGPIYRHPTPEEPFDPHIAEPSAQVERPAKSPKEKETEHTRSATKNVPGFDHLPIG
jgi:hypothetical protein